MNSNARMNQVANESTTIQNGPADVLLPIEDSSPNDFIDIESMRPSHSALASRRNANAETNSTPHIVSPRM